MPPFKLGVLLVWALYIPSVIPKYTPILDPVCLIANIIYVLFEPLSRVSSLTTISPANLFPSQSQVGLKSSIKVLKTDSVLRAMRNDPYYVGPGHCSGVRVLRWVVTGPYYSRRVISVPILWLLTLCKFLLREWQAQVDSKL